MFYIYSFYCLVKSITCNYKHMVIPNWVARSGEDDPPRKLPLYGYRSTASHAAQQLSNPVRQGVSILKTIPKF